MRISLIVAAAEKLEADGFMLREDVERAADHAGDWDRLRHGITLI